MHERKILSQRIRRVELRQFATGDDRRHVLFGSWLQGSVEVFLAKRAQALPK
jgi:hypothetical protein